MIHERDDRAAAKRLLGEAVAAYDKVASVLGGPGTLLRLATLEAEDGTNERALEHVEDALARLALHPLAGQSGRLLREKLERLLETMRLPA